MSVSGQRICALAEEAADAADPEAALETLTRIRDELQEFERQQVARALTSGRSYGDVARAMGISRQAAHRRFKDLLKRNAPLRAAAAHARGAAGVRVRARGGAGARGVRARPRARGARHPAQWRPAGGCGAHGERARARGRARGGPWRGGRGRQRRAGKVDIRNMLAETAQCARKRGAEQVEVEHLLRSALANDDHGAGGMLERLGVAPDRVLAELEAAPQGDADCLEA